MDRIEWWHYVVFVVLIAGISVGVACMGIHAYDWLRHKWWKHNIPDRFKHLGDSDECSK